jgi:hypothetical protein
MVDDAHPTYKMILFMSTYLIGNKVMENTPLLVQEGLRERFFN